MPFRNRIKRRDDNHFEITQAIEQHGAVVTDTSQIGSFVDCVFVYRRKVYLCEIKDGKKAKSARKLTPNEQKFHDSVRGIVLIFTSIDDVVGFFKGLPVQIVSDRQ